MKFYPPKVSRRFNDPHHAGQAPAGANATGTGAAFVCGAVLRFTLRIDPQTKEIREAKFKTDGCGYAIAAAEVLAEKITGKLLAELHGLDESILQKEVENELGAFDHCRKHCFELAVETLHAAFADFRRSQIEEWTGEKALICTCFGVSEEIIERHIESGGLETIEAVTAACSAGGGCGSCQPLIEDILEIYWRENG